MSHTRKYLQFHFSMFNSPPFQIPGAVKQYYKIGLVFCRSNISFKNPKSLAELSAGKLSDTMAERERSQGRVSSVCTLNGCKHASKQCKHYHPGESSSGVLPSNPVKSRAQVSREESSRTERVKKDNGLKAPDIYISKSLD